jgi:2-haloacid dehalogenase
MITTIFFDLDDTLLDFHAGEGVAIRQTLEHMGISPTDAVVRRYSQLNQSQWELLEQGRITRDQVLHRRFALLFQELGVDRDSHQTQALYEDLLSRQHQWLPGAQALLDQLAGRYGLYLVSNGTAPVQDRRLADTGMGRYFQGVFISERVGCDKPNPEFFRRCFAQIPDFHRENAIILGDSLTSDIQGGKNAGIQTCWFNPHKKPATSVVPDHEIAALEDFPALLERL